MCVIVLPANQHTRLHKHGKRIYLCCCYVGRRSVHCIPQFFDSDPIRTDDTLSRRHRILKIAYRNIAFLYKNKNQNRNKYEFLNRIVI